MAVKLLFSGTASDVAVLSHAVSRSGWDASTDASTDGYHTVELAVRVKPDIIVTDPSVPRLRGVELVRRLRAVAPQTAVVCWADSADPAEAAELIRAGAVGYLLKQDGPGEVVRSIGAVLDGGSVVAPKVAALLLETLAEGVHRERRLSRALSDATLKVQEVTHGKAEFLANVSHELRTPVTIVKGLAHLLRGGLVPREEQDDFLMRMDRAVDRLTTLVDEIISIADIDRGEVAFELGRMDVVRLVSDVCDRMAHRYPLVKVDTDLPERLDAVIDARWISESVAQLVDNACRYSPTPGTVQVRIRKMTEGVVFSVTDAGQGLSRELASTAFSEPFVTGEEILRKERAGVGLGLHLARRLILLHGGTLWTDPLPAGGTRVSFCVPIDPTGASDHEDTFEVALAAEARTTA
jgi:signal transduction histidine kinase